MSHFFPVVHPQDVWLQNKLVSQNALVKRYSDADLLPSPATNITSCYSCLLITSALSHAFMQFPTIRWLAQSLQVPTSRCHQAAKPVEAVAASPPGTTFTSADGFTRWAVPSSRICGGCCVGWRFDGDYWVTWLCDGWSLRGDVFAYHEVEWSWSGFCGKMSEFGHGIFSDGVEATIEVSRVEVFVELSNALLVVCTLEN